LTVLTKYYISLFYQTFVKNTRKQKKTEIQKLTQSNNLRRTHSVWQVISICSFYCFTCLV